ncbi:purine transporter [Diplocarpon rosae]|nr:purine transporter [Diplocarpon rosae]
MVAVTTQINDAVATSCVGRRFRLEGSGHPKARHGARFLTEIRAGLATFFAMAYIISVNANITTASGGTCGACEAETPFDCPLQEEYGLCLGRMTRDFITGTAAISALTSFGMGLFANMPIALAPGMGLNAYFAYTVVGPYGFGPVSYELALTAIFMEGFVFVALSLLGMRQWLARAIPASIKLGSGVGIGLYLTIIGMTYSAGIGAIVGASSTPLELAGCTQAILDANDGTCPTSEKMRSPTLWIGIFCGGFLTAVLLMYKVKGAIIAGILLVSIISWPRSTDVTYFPHTVVGDANFDFFKKVVTFHPIRETLGVNEWDISGASSQFGLAFLTFLYVDILDCTGTLYSMARFSGAIDPETQDFEGSAVAYLVDAFGISIGSLLGLSPVTAFIESGAGISEGGKTGITAMVTGICFFISIFFAPIFASIPPWATGCTLIIVGAMMASAAKDINWNKKDFWHEDDADATISTAPHTPDTASRHRAEDKVDSAVINAPADAEKGSKLA